jgi:DNA-directed RNA polymerase subunit M/transcription elongation factor TFIIS
MADLTVKDIVKKNTALYLELEAYERELRRSPINSVINPMLVECIQTLKKQISEFQALKLSVIDDNKNSDEPNDKCSNCNNCKDEKKIYLKSAKHPDSRVIGAEVNITLQFNDGHTKVITVDDECGDCENERISLESLIDYALVCTKQNPY